MAFFILLPIPFCYRILLLLTLCSSFIACEEQHERNYKEITGEEFPKDAELKIKQITPTDFHGDYGSFLLVKVGSDSYNNLPGKLLKKGFVVEPPKTGSSEFTLDTFNISSQYRLEGSDKFYIVGFLADHESIILIRSSW